MKAGKLLLRVVSPIDPFEIEDVTHVRFDADDGSRGVLPGHERATVRVREGVIYLRVGEPASTPDLFVVTEGGMAVIEPRRVVVVTSWAAQATDMDELAQHVRRRSERRARVDREARALGERHEVALRRALMGLKREVSW